MPATHVDQRRTPDVICNALEGELKGMTEEPSHIRQHWILGSIFLQLHGGIT